MQSKILALLVAVSVAFSAPVLAIEFPVDHLKRKQAERKKPAEYSHQKKVKASKEMQSKPPDTKKKIALKNVEKSKVASKGKEIAPPSKQEKICQGQVGRKTYFSVTSGDTLCLSNCLYRISKDGLGDAPKSGAVYRSSGLACQ